MLTNAQDYQAEIPSSLLREQEIQSEKLKMH